MWRPYKQILSYCTSQILVLFIYFFFYKLKVCGSPTLSAFWLHFSNNIRSVCVCVTFWWFLQYFKPSTGIRASLVVQRLKCLPAMRETWVRSLGPEDPLEKEMATHSSILAWRTPWTEEPGGLQSTGSQRVGHDWATSHTCTPLKTRMMGSVFSYKVLTKGCMCF